MNCSSFRVVNVKWFTTPMKLISRSEPEAAGPVAWRATWEREIVVVGGSAVKAIVEESRQEGALAISERFGSWV